MLLGVEISYALTAFHTGKTQTRHPVLMLLDMLELFYQKQKDGKSVTDEEALNILGRGEIGRWPAYVRLLEQQNIIKRTESDQYVLVRNLDHLDFWSFYKSLPYTLPDKEDVGHIHEDDVWMQRIGPALVESDDYLAAKLSIPLSTILDQK